MEKAARITGSAARNRAATEEKLLKAGLDVFSRHGYDGASVKQIAEASGSNVSLINRYFGGKEGLLLTLVKRLVVDKQEGELGYPPQPTLKAEIFEYLRYRLTVDAANDKLIRILVSRVMTDQTFRRDVMQVVSGEADANFRARLETLRENGRIAAETDIDQVFMAVSNLSFSANVLGHLVMGRTRSELLTLFEHFSSVYAAGLARTP